MSFFSKQRDPKRRRFPIPNDVWKWELKPQGFAILAYRCYLHVHCKEDTLPSVDEIASQLHMGKDMAAKQLSELNRRGLLDQHMVPMLESSGKNFFSLPNELFFLNIGHGAITVYAYLLYCENRRTHQCHPSYRTISDAVHLAVSTVMKHITKLVDKQLTPVQHEQIDENAYRTQHVGSHLRQQVGQRPLHTLHLIHNDLFHLPTGCVQNGAQRHFGELFQNLLSDRFQNGEGGLVGDGQC